MLKYLRLGLIVAILQTLAYLTSIFFTQRAVSTWYSALNKAPINPPDWAFPLAWLILYTLIAISFWKLYENRNHPKAKSALIIFSIQLILNYAWTPIFFGMRNYTLAFYECIALVISIILTIIYAHKVSKTASLILIPYLFWAAFATYLTYYVMVHN